MGAHNLKLYTQLNFGGNCEEAFRYYEKHVGGKITSIFYQKQLPPGSPLPSDSGDFVIHSRPAADVSLALHQYSVLLCVLCDSVVILPRRSRSR